MTRERAKSMDQRSFGRSCTAEATGKLCRPPMASPEPGRMLAFPPFQGFIRGMSAWGMLMDLRNIASVRGANFFEADIGLQDYLCDHVESFENKWKSTLSDFGAF